MASSSLNEMGAFFEATGRRVTVAAPGAIYFDTSLLTTAIFRPVAHHDSAIRFCQQLNQQPNGRNTTLYFSELVRLEYAQALRTMALRLTDSTYREFRLDRWDQIRVRQRWVDYGNGLLEVFLREYRWVEVALDRGIIDEATQLMVSCNLSSYDAAHVATALSLGITDHAAVDSHFERASHLLAVHIIRSTLAAS